MSVIASNSVNFVPIYQLLKNFSDTKPKEILEEQEFEKISNDILDVAELSSVSKAGHGVQTDPITSVKIQPEVIIEKPINVMDQQQSNVQSVIQNADSIRSFIVDSKEKAMAQQANQSRKNAMFLI